MPRKKPKQKTVKYLIPEGLDKKVAELVNKSDKYKRKEIWKQKFFYLLEYISNQFYEKDELEYVNIHIAMMAEMLAVNNQQMSSILRDLIKHEILEKDGISKTALTTIRNGEKIYLKDGKSYGYKFIEKKPLVIVSILDNRHFASKTILKQNIKFIVGESMKNYHEILNKITIDSSLINNTISEIIENKKKKIESKKEYKRFISNKESEYHNKSNNNKVIQPFSGVIVPIKSAKNEHRIFTSKQRCNQSPFVIKKFIKNKIVIVEPELVDGKSIRARCLHYIDKINRGEIIPKRPVKDSRVYSLITNLNREFRKSILLDGKMIIGIDIRNSQPLIASILIRRYWLNKQDELPEDVIEYQKACEQGRFYDDFMEKLDLPANLRSEFKQDFFQKVFFSKVIAKSNILKDMFIEKYPSVWSMICDEKGGLYCMEYNEFAKKLQMVESAIIYDTVNVELMKRGISAFNIFDSIYVTSYEDYKIAEELLRKAFNEVGVNPTFNIEYEEHLDKNEQELSITEF